MAALKKAGDRTAETQQLAEVQKALQQEQDKAVGLARDLAAARRETETLKKAADKPVTDPQLAELQKALKQEHDKAVGLAQDLVTARRENETQAAALKKAADKSADTQQLAKLYKDAANTYAVFVNGPDGVKLEYVEHKPSFSLV